MKATPPASPTPPPPPPAVPGPVPAAPTADAAKTPPAVARWPGWFGPVDLLAVMLVLTAAVMAGSFTARNADVWRHLAAGRGLFDGTYSLGSDPFSYTGADRPWVNASWLTDAAAYLVFSADPSGAALVAVKAVAFALAFGLPMVLRRPGRPLWPWAVFAAIGFLAAAPMASLRPTVLSMAFLAATYTLVYCCPWRPGSWRKPAYFAGLFALWANVDEWFVLGPFALALLLVGGLIDRRVLGQGEPDAADPFPPSPPVDGLAKALLLGVVGCLLNPTLLVALARDPGEAAAQLVPVELGWTLPEGAKSDDMVRVLTLSPIGEGYADQPARGYNTNGLMAAVLLVGGAVVLAGGFARLRAAQIALWVGFAALALQSYRLIPFFAVVAVPLAAGHLAGLAGRVKLGPKAAPGTQILLTGSMVGRVLMAVVAVGLVVAAWPGWLHTQQFRGDPGFAHYVDWKVVPDAGLARTAARMEKWRTGEAGPALPADARGLQTMTQFADVCAWFAPSERVFADGRLVFHRAELADLAAARRAVANVRSATTGDEVVAGLNPLAELMDGRGIAYVAFTSDRGPADSAVSQVVIADPPGWGLWALDGRSAVVGRAGTRGADGLRFDPIREAYGPDIEPVPEHRATFPPPAAPGAFDEYVARPEVPSPWADDAQVYVNYAGLLEAKVRNAWNARRREQFTARAVVVGAAAADRIVPAPFPTPPDAVAAVLLAVRSARRAVAATPDRPEGYLALALAYSSPLVPSTDQSSRPLQGITARVMYLNRLPPPASAGATEARFATSAARELAELYLQTGQLDLAREAVKTAVAYVERIAEIDPGTLARAIPPTEKVTGPADLVKKFSDQSGLADLEAQITATVQTQNDRYQSAVDRGNPSPTEKFALAMKFGFPGRAIDLYQAAPENAYGPAVFDVSAGQIAAKLRAGRLPEAVSDIDEFDKLVTAERDKGKPLAPQQTAQIDALKLLAARLQGNYPAAGEILRDQAAGLRPPLPEDLRLARPGTELAISAAAGIPAAALYVDRVTPVREALAAESWYSFNRGVYALLGGATGDARQWFERARYPQGADAAELGVPAPANDASLFLGLLQAADRTPAPPK